MNISCVQCHQSLPMTATFCNACGRPVDADKDGVPDALGNMIEAKARAIVAQEQAKRDEAAARQTNDDLLRKLTADATELQTQLDQNAKMPRSWLGAFAHLATMLTISCAIIWLLFGALIHLFIFGLLDVSPAGVVLCPSHCEGCDGPGRVFSYNYKGSWQEKNGRMGYALVCHNREVNIDALKWSEVRSDPLNTKLQPYMISGFVSFAVEGLVLAPTIGIVAAALLANRNRKHHDVARAELIAKVRLNEAQRAALGAPGGPAGGYRAPGG